MKWKNGGGGERGGGGKGEGVHCLPVAVGDAWWYVSRWFIAIRALSLFLDLGVWDLSVSFDLGIFGEDLSFVESDTLVSFFFFFFYVSNIE